MATTTIKGTTKSETLRGTDGVDVITGGKGNDKLYGYGGNNWYVFNAGDGQDTVYSTGKSDTLKFNTVATASDFVKKLNFTKTTDNGLKIGYTSTDFVTVDKYFTASAVEYLQAKDGTRILLSDLLKKVTVKNEATIKANESPTTTIYGTSGNDTLNGSSGVDKIYGRAGNDKLYGKEGNDFLYGEDGVDYLYGGAGNDYLYGGAGNDYLYGEAGNDYLYGNGGADTINAGAGTNFIYFSEGDGADKVVSGGGTDTLMFAEGTKVTGAYSGLNAVITYGTKGDKITLDNYSSSHSVKYIQVGSTKKAISTYLPSVKELKTTSTKTLIYGTAGADRIFGGSTDDYLMGKEGNDTISGGAGDDIIDGGVGNDVIYGGAGNDEITDYYGNNTVVAGDGDDTIYLSNGNNNVYGNKGDDIMYLTNGTNKLYFSEGDGIDTVLTYDTNAYASNQGFNSSSNTLIFANNTPIKVSLNTNEYLFLNSSMVINPFFMAFEISYGSKGDKVYIGERSDLGKTNYIQVGSVKKSISDYLPEITNVMAGKTIKGTSNDDVFLVNSPIMTNYLNPTGLSGQTNITGGKGNDTIINNAYSYGGTLNLIFNAGDGNDIFHAYYSMIPTIGDNKKFTFNNLNTVSDLSKIKFTKVGEDLKINYTTDDSVTIKNTIISSNSPSFPNVEISAKNGASKTMSEVITAAGGIKISGSGTINGTDFDDVINGSSGNDTISTGDGNDTVYGGAGNDIITSSSVYSYEKKLYGGAGNDTIYGASDIYNYINAGDGNDVIYSQGYADEIYGGAGNDKFIFRQGSTSRVKGWLSDGTGSNTISIENLSHNVTRMLINVDKSGNILNFTMKNYNPNIPKSTGCALLATHWSWHYSQFQNNSTSDLDSIELYNKATVNSLNKIEANDGYYISQASIQRVTSEVASWLTSKGYNNVQQAIYSDTSNGNLNTLIAMFNNNVWTQGT